MKLILASSSPFRKEILSRLKLPFSQISPDIDESLLPHELPQEAVKRLAKNKARKISKANPDAWIIASDQLAVCNGNILGKPHTFENAFKQLKSQSGQIVNFYTSVILMNEQHSFTEAKVIKTEVKFKSLSDRQIRVYLEKDQPFQCAGSFKSESLGVTLFESIASSDPDALMGLPLMTLIHQMETAGIDPLMVEENFK